VAAGRYDFAIAEASVERPGLIVQTLPAKAVAAIPYGDGRRQEERRMQALHRRIIPKQTVRLAAENISFGPSSRREFVGLRWGTFATMRR
jgi:hypothetical protein